MCEDTSHSGRGETLNRVDTCGNWLQTCPMSLLGQNQPPDCLGQLSGELRENIHHKQTVRLDHDSHWPASTFEVHCLLVYLVDRLVDCGLWSLVTNQTLVMVGKCDKQTSGVHNVMPSCSMHICSSLLVNGTNYCITQLPKRLLHRTHRRKTTTRCLMGWRGWVLTTTCSPATVTRQP